MLRVRVECSFCLLRNFLDLQLKFLCFLQAALAFEFADSGSSAGKTGFPAIYKGSVWLTNAVARLKAHISKNFEVNARKRTPTR